MAEKTYTRWEALAVAVAERAEEIATDAVIALDTDTMCACLFRKSVEKDVSVLASKESSKEPFFERAAKLLLNAPDMAEALKAACADMNKSFLNFIKSGKSEEYNKALPSVPGCDGTLTCMQLTKLYEDEYEADIRRLVDEMKSQVQAEGVVPVVMVGSCARFYPMQHTIKAMLSLMPMLPVVPGFILKEELLYSSGQLVEEGMKLLKEREEARKCITHNIMMQTKRVVNGNVEPDLRMMASKGDAYSSFEQPRYGAAVLVHASDSVVLLSDTKPFEITLPRTVFAKGSPCTMAQFAIGLDGETPALLVKSETGVAKVGLDAKIYSEGLTNE